MRRSHGRLGPSRSARAAPSTSNAAPFQGVPVISIVSMSLNGAATSSSMGLNVALFQSTASAVTCPADDLDQGPGEVSGSPAAGLLSESEAESEPGPGDAHWHRD
jgi:hypothetical protein